MDSAPSSETRPPAHSELDMARTGPDTLMGRYMRRFWQPIYRSQDLEKGHAKPVRIMGGDYTLYRGESGAPQLIDNTCPHRGALLHMGWVEGEAIRCIYHGWKFDQTGQCVEQPAEGSSFARKVKIRSYPTREYLKLIFAYFGEGEPPPFPPFPEALGEGLIDTPASRFLPCNWFQSFENSFDEVHVSFVHRTGGSHEGMYDLPEISCEETDWGLLRLGKRANGETRVSLHYMPNVTRVIVPQMAGMNGVGGWREMYLCFVPIDDENHKWLATTKVRVTGKDAEAYLAQRDKYDAARAAAPPEREVAAQIVAGNLRFQDVRHPDLVAVQDIASQSGQGRIADRSNEWLGKSDLAIIAWRKIIQRELKALAEGRPLKQWKVAPPDVVPTFGF